MFLISVGIIPARVWFRADGDDVRDLLISCQTEWMGGL